MNFRQIFTTLLAGLLLATGLQLSTPATSEAASTSTGSCTVAPMRDAHTASARMFAKEIRWARCRGISGGYSDRTFRAERVLTRTEAGVMLSRYLGRKAPFSGSAKVKRHTVANALMTAHRGRLQHGGTLSPFNDLPAKHSSFPAMGWAYANGLLTRDGNSQIRASGSVTRGQMVAILYRLDQLRTTRNSIPGSMIKPSADRVGSSASAYRIVRAELNRLPHGRSTRLLMVPANGTYHGKAHTEYGAVEVVSTAGGTARLRHVVQHEQAHLLQRKVAPGAKYFELRERLNRIHGTSGILGMEQNADCISKVLNGGRFASKPSYTSNCSGARDRAARAIVNGRMP